VSIQVEDIKICIENCWIMKSGREGVMESDGGGWTDQSKELENSCKKKKLRTF
jgi:hypothetical protein